MIHVLKHTCAEFNKKRLKESFDLMDSDKDGYLDYHETKAAFKALGFVVKKSYVLTMMRMYDKRGCNRISFEDFYYIGMFNKIVIPCGSCIILHKFVLVDYQFFGIHIVSKLLNTQSSLDEVKYAFKLLTNNSVDKKISLEDLQRLNKKLECSLTMEEMELMIKEFDVDQDGCINESEFMEIIMDFGI